MKIVGFYQGNERGDDAALHASTKRLGDLVRDRGGFSRACLLLLNNESFTAFLSGDDQTSALPFSLHVKRPGGSWEASKLECLGGATVSVIRELSVERLNKGIEKEVVDFSEHVCDLSKDWRNQQIFS